jgi:hypothetical protein
VKPGGVPERVVRRRIELVGQAERPAEWLVVDRAAVGVPEELRRRKALYPVALVGSLDVGRPAI